MTNTIDALSDIAPKERIKHKSSIQLLNKVVCCTFFEVGPTVDYDATKTTDGTRHYSYVKAAPDSYKMLVKRINDLMYDDFKDQMLFYMERELLRRLQTTPDLKDQLSSVMPMKVSYPASVWAALDVDTTGMAKTWSTWINGHAIAEVDDHDSPQEDLFKSFKIIYRQQGNVCFECCRQPSSVQICCPQAKCQVIFLDACMYKIVKDKGGTYQTREQKIVESIMRQNALIGHHALDKNETEVQRIGPYYKIMSIYCHLLSS